MTELPQVPLPSDERTPGDRLDSWKEIAGYMRRDVKTVQRWEKREGMPIHRHVHDKLGSVYAFRSELDEWADRRRQTTAQDAASLPRDDASAAMVLPVTAERDDADASPMAIAGTVQHGSHSYRWVAAALAALLGVAAAGAWALLAPRTADAPNPLADARFRPLTDFNGVEQAAAISRDGRLVAFLSDRDGQMDVWITDVGSGEFHNLTRGTVRELVNASVRTLDFSPDGTLVTFWTRRLDPSQQSEIGVWAVPVLGGSPRVYLQDVAEYHVSSDGARIVYHTPGAGDPMFVRNLDDRSPPTRIFSAPEGLHGHFPLWSPDHAFIYFVQGAVPDRMDIWRISPGGGTPERVTTHNAMVSHPVFLDARTLVYLATDADGSGPWIYSVDVERRASRRVSSGIERYTSLAASGDGRRLVATLATPKSTLWRVSSGSGPARLDSARAVSLNTGNGSSPRLGDGFLVYVSSTGTSDTIWKLQGDRATQVWNAPGARVLGGPALARDGRRVAFAARGEDGAARLWVVNIDGTNARAIAGSLDVQGAPAWAPDGDALAVAALVDGVPNLFTVPIDGAPPAPLVRDHARDPSWSPRGDTIVFSGPDVGTTFALKAVDGEGHARRIPAVTLTRGAGRVAFVNDTASLVVLRGDLRRKDLWSIDLATGAERQLTDFGSDFELRDFDVSSDGREIVVEQVQEHSDIVLLERAGEGLR